MGVINPPDADSDLSYEGSDEEIALFDVESRALVVQTPDEAPPAESDADPESDSTSSRGSPRRLFDESVLDDSSSPAIADVRADTGPGPACAAAAFAAGSAASGDAGRDRARKRPRPDANTRRRVTHGVRFVATTDSRARDAMGLGMGNFIGSRLLRSWCYCHRWP